MKLLTQLSSAGALITLYGKSASLKEILKHTFMDLLVKKVLKTIEIKRASSRKGYFRLYTYLVVGSNYSKHKILSHERVFLAPLEKNALHKFYLDIGCQSVSKILNLRVMFILF